MPKLVLNAARPKNRFASQASEATGLRYVWLRNSDSTSASVFFEKFMSNGIVDATLFEKVSLLGIKSKTPFGGKNRRALLLSSASLKGCLSTPVRLHSIATASDDRGRTATATTSGELNSSEKHT